MDEFETKCNVDYEETINRLRNGRGILLGGLCFELIKKLKTDGWKSQQRGIYTLILPEK